MQWKVIGLKYVPNNKKSLLLPHEIIIPDSFFRFHVIDIDVGIQDCTYLCCMRIFVIRMPGWITEKPTNSCFLFQWTSTVHIWTIIYALYVMSLRKDIVVVFLKKLIFMMMHVLVYGIFYVYMWTVKTTYLSPTHETLSRFPIFNLQRLYGAAISKWYKEFRRGRFWTSELAQVCNRELKK